MKQAAVLSVLLALYSSPCFAEDAYLIRFNTAGRSANGSYWRDDVLFFNTNAVPVEVKFLGVSNSTPVTDAPTLELPPQKVMSLTDNWPIGDRWEPNEFTPLYILHVDVPRGVIIESRDEFWVVVPSEGGTTPVAKASLPVLRELTPADVPQVHVGTDIGRTPSHINVAIYNAGSEMATAVVEVRRPCEDVPVTTARAAIAPDSVIQLGGLSIGSHSRSCGYFGSPYGFVRIVTVRVDQPSLSFITNIARGPCSADGAVPCVGFAVSINSRF